MQMQIPIFPSNTKYINDKLGFFKSDELVQYVHIGSPIFCHHQDDMPAFRFISGNLIENGLCTISELSNALGVNRRNIERYAQSVREKGTGYFFQKHDRRGQCHKMTLNIIDKAQQFLDAGQSHSKIAKLLGVSESSIRYHLRKGSLKKKR